jgi:serine/threonine protein kinase
LEDSQYTQTQTDFTQNELTQLGDGSQSQLVGSPSTPLNPRQVPWGRLLCGDEGRFDLLPRDPTHNINESKQGGNTYLGCLHNILPSDIFNEYKLGRNSKADIRPPKPTSDDENHKVYAWAHSMVSNLHCKIYCRVEDSELQVFCQDSSGNGTIVNGTTLLRKGETRRLHTGDEICLVNPHPLRKKIRDPKLLQKIQRRFAYVFVNLQHQQSLQWPSTKRKVKPASARRGVVNVRAMAHHSLEHPSAVKPTTEASNRIEQYYDLRDLLGTGTCGQVRRAISRKTGQEFAVKIISLRKHVGDITSLQVEAKILQELDHPYIVKLYDVFLHPGVALYLVMELMAGGDLFDRIVSKEKYTEVESRRTMRRLLNAVYYLHECMSLVHRDLKPENILCKNRHSDMDVAITDFGVAKQVQRDGLKTFCGTPHYLAPEVLRRHYTVAGTGRYGKAVDMWSLGVILYVLLSGTPPFDIAGEGMDVVVDRCVEFPEQLWKGVSTLAKDLVKKLIVTDPDERFSVVQACNHPWLLMADGDTHTHPLDNPEAPMREKEETPSKRLFESTTTAAEESLSADQSPNKGSPQANLSSEENSSSIHRENQDNTQDMGTSDKESRVSPVREDKASSSQVTPPETSIIPPNLNSRSNHFRDIIRQSVEKERSSPDRSHKKETTELVFAITPSKTKGIKRKAKKGKVRDSSITESTELTDDEICSRFSDDESASSFSASTVTTKTNGMEEKSHNLNRNGSAYSCSYGENKENTATPPMHNLDREKTYRPTKRKVSDETASLKDEKGAHREEPYDAAEKKRKMESTGKQTTLAGWVRNSGMNEC